MPNHENPTYYPANGGDLKVTFCDDCAPNLSLTQTTPTRYALDVAHSATCPTTKGAA